jgi:hypothetical protein
MKGICQELNDIIKDEVSTKKALSAAKEICEVRRPITRRSIEDILAAKQLEANLGLSL